VAVHAAAAAAQAAVPRGPSRISDKCVTDFTPRGGTQPTGSAESPNADRLGALRFLPLCLRATVEPLCYSGPSHPASPGSAAKRIRLAMPTISVDKAALFKELGREYAQPFFLRPLFQFYKLIDKSL